MLAVINFQISSYQFYSDCSNCLLPNPGIFLHNYDLQNYTMWYPYINFKTKVGVKV